jgi:flavin-dependent dehydrogenase
MAVVDRDPELSERIRAGRREVRIYGAAQLPNFLRKPHGPGWALVGDAGCHKDPFAALGVCDRYATRSCSPTLLRTRCRRAAR